MALRVCSHQLTTTRAKSAFSWFRSRNCDCGGCLPCPGKGGLSRPLPTFWCVEKTCLFYGQLIYRKFLFKFPPRAVKPEDSCTH